MKRAYLLFLILILFQVNTFSQELESVWISSHNKNIFIPKKKNNNKDTQSNSYDSLILEEMEVEEIDTSYSEAYMLLDFKNSKEVIVKGIGGKTGKGKYKLRKNKLKIRVENQTLKGRIENNKLIFSFKNGKYRKEELVFEKMRNSELNASLIPDSSTFYNTHWKVIADTSSINYGLNFHFLDSNFVIITRIHSKYRRTNWGEFKIDNYNNHLFLGVINRNFGENYIFNVYKQKNKSYYANTYEVMRFIHKPPLLVNLRLEKIPFLTNSVLDSIKNKLIGNWHAINEPIPCESNKFKLENQYFSLEFEKERFIITKGGNLNYGNKEIPKEIIIKGSWKLSPTGQYLTLQPDNSWTRYVSINVLEMDYAEFDMTIKAFEENYSNTGIIELKKNNKP
ncbi:MAG: hypothetical protein JEY96_19660 [Bacteroidales bacterium]|nr:hypothetical protein [Bacteroidales bacterium]